MATSFEIDVKVSGSEEIDKLIQASDRLKKSFSDLANQTEQAFGRISKAMRTAGIPTGDARQPMVSPPPSSGGRMGDGGISAAGAGGGGGGPARFVTQQQYRFTSPAWGMGGAGVSQMMFGNVLTGALSGLQSIITAMGGAGGRLLNRLPLPGWASSTIRGLAGMGGGAAGALLSFGAGTFQNALRLGEQYQKQQLTNWGVFGGLKGYPGGEGLPFAMTDLEWMQREAGVRRALAPSMQMLGGRPILGGRGVVAAEGGLFTRGAGGRFEYAGGRGGALGGELADLAARLSRTTILTESSINRMINAYQRQGATADQISRNILRINESLRRSGGGRMSPLRDPAQLAYRFAYATGAPPEQIISAMAGINYPRLPWAYERERNAALAGMDPATGIAPGYPDLGMAVTPGTGRGALTRLAAGMGPQQYLTGLTLAMGTGGSVTLDRMRELNRMGYRSRFGFDVSQLGTQVMPALSQYWQMVGARQFGMPSGEALARGAWGIGVMHERLGMDPTRAARMLGGMDLARVGGGAAGQFMMFQAAGHRAGMHPYIARLRMDDPSTRISVLRNMYRGLVGTYGRGVAGRQNMYATLGPILGLSPTQFEQMFAPGKEGGRSAFEEYLSTGGDWQQFRKTTMFQMERIRGGSEKLMAPEFAGLGGLPKLTAELTNVLTRLGQTPEVVRAGAALIQASIDAVLKVSETIRDTVKYIPGMKDGLDKLVKQIEEKGVFQVMKDGIVHMGRDLKHIAEKF